MNGTVATTSMTEILCKRIIVSQAKETSSLANNVLCSAAMYKLQGCFTWYVESSDASNLHALHAFVQPRYHLLSLGILHFC